LYLLHSRGGIVLTTDISSRSGSLERGEDSRHTAVGGRSVVSKQGLWGGERQGVTVGRGGHWEGVGSAWGAEKWNGFCKSPGISCMNLGRDAAGTDGSPTTREIRQARLSRLHGWKRSCSPHPRGTCQQLAPAKGGGGFEVIFQIRSETAYHGLSFSKRTVPVTGGVNTSVSMMVKKGGKHREAGKN